MSEQERHLPDILDRASAVEMEANERAIQEAQARCRQARQPRADGSYEDTSCEECGEEIEEQRLRLAPRNNLCIYCARAAERFTRK